MAQDGGAICFFGLISVFLAGAWVKFENSIVQSNSAQNGGAVALYVTFSTNYLMSFTNVSFISNSAAVQGGCIYMQNDAVLTLDDVRFQNCSAGNTGSALGLHGSGTGFGGLVASNCTIISPRGFPNSSFQSSQVFVQSLGIMQGSMMSAKKVFCVGGILTSITRDTSFRQSTLSQVFVPFSFGAGGSFQFISSDYVTPSQSWVAQCTACPEGTYALDDPNCYGKVNQTDNCLPCPSGASCDGGIQVESNQG